MLVFGTQMHVVTFIFILLECFMLVFQLAYYLLRPRDPSRIWYLILLSLMLFYNITGGLFPDPQIRLAVPIQEMIAYGSGFLMASYFPFYFYKAFNLNSLRWHALYGVPLFLWLPYVIFFVLAYSINGNLPVDIKLGMVAPLIYALVLLVVIFRAIQHQHRTKRSSHVYLEEIVTYCAISPWASLAVFGVVEQNQLVEVLCTNSGIVMITVLFIWTSIRKERQNYARNVETGNYGFRSGAFNENVKTYRLTNREIQIILLLRRGLTYRQISEDLFISGKTVDNHVQNIYEKTQVKNKLSLFHKLQI
ncbi:response regulator transcription factor [Mucilaginibacter sp. SP1R1]|uniref:response regulator transcription factor n=1 Tax=Mucilaginibacter sp. SP1R1 TaxID=2723091 RepID=UPI001617FD99|nr:helix-turn-helix transcriptional regulator [Mucilaginibacter sp. SP1R1]MBB6152407.1 DNA-binding CsgD family transcriptional regulator [Mucilaginibacter sp. SP1R1]